MANPGSKEIRIFVGTYTGRAEPEADAIFVYRLDRSSGALELLATAKGIVNPSFLSIAPGGKTLYAVCEVAEFEGQPSGAVAAFSIEPGTGALTLLNQKPSRGSGPCHLALDPTGKHVLVANYSGGSVAVLPVESGGALGDPSDFRQLEGSSVDPERQEAPHAHSVAFAPTYASGSQASRLFVQDLGTDRIWQYRLDTQRGVLIENEVPFVKTTPGAGPRHFAFHPRLPFGYLINELNSTINAFSYDEHRGTLREIQTVPTLPTPPTPPGDFSGTNYCADIHVSASGKFLYGSNRGHDSIALYTIDPDSGRLRPEGHEPTGGRTPRNFALDPTDTWLLAANQDSGTIVSFRLDPETGHLTPSGEVCSVPKPVCVRMLERPA